MLMIRLRRGGAKKHPMYRLVVSDSHKTPLSTYLEQVGTYDPHLDPPVVHLDLEKIDEWCAKGAGMSETVKSLVDKARKQN